MTVPENLRYTKDHEWVKPMTAGRVRIGITYHGQRQLGDVVIVDLPDPGTKLTESEQFGQAESVTNAMQVYAPVSGTVWACNERLHGDPELINTDPYGDGWLIDLGDVAPDTVDGLLDAAGYTEYIKGDADQ